VKRRSIVLFAALAMALTTFGPSVAAEESSLPLDTSRVERGQYDSYVVIMRADPLVVTEGENLDTKRARNRGQQLRASHNKALRDAGLNTSKIVNQYVTALNGFSALINHAQAEKIAADKNVLMVLPDELLQPQTDESGDFLGLSGAGSAYATGFTGKGVVVGIIDTGIWPEHPSFADVDTPAPPVSGIPCEFGNTAHNPNDAPFTCQDKLVGARQMLATYRALIGADPDEFDSARDDSGHGSHTASTTAGNDGVSASILGSPVGDGTISGIAYDAHIIAYKGLGNLGGFSSDLAAAIDQAVEDGVDVINYSIGGGGGVLGADDIAFLFAADAGVYVAASAGNSGPGAKTIGSPGDNPWLTSVGASTQSRFFAGTIELGNGATYEGASVTDGVGPVGIVDAATAAPGPNGDLCISTATKNSKLSPGKVKGKIVLCRRGVNARVDKSLAVKNAGGVGMIMYENTNDNNLFTDTHWVPSVHIDNTPGLAIKAYIASAGRSATAEIRDTRSISTWPSAPSMTLFSSRGPNNYPDVIKPDITAPGLQILAGNSPFPDPGTVGGELFQAIAGTSMSSPHVAGLFALLKQANPSWSAAAARSALMTTAHQDVVDNNRTSPADPFDMGSGHADPSNASSKGSSFQPGLVYDADFLDYLNWLCGASPANISAAYCASTEAAGESTDPSDLNYPSIAVADLAGSQTVTRTVTSVASEARPRTYNVSVDTPAGYGVTVSPSTITLRRGQSATFEVTIVNNSAPIGVWRFGSLTWNEQGGNYAVRSPIAVKGSLFDAPSEVDGSGESGSASFDVKFGYTGDYDATAHGLVPALVTTGNVPQDPDQAFSRTDGFSDDIPITLSGAGVFRIAMPPDAVDDADADIDIYVFNPSGVQVASSTAGGTDELITINNPADGTWHVWIHGWSAPGGDTNYTLYTWDVSATPGGTLVIDSEPADATIGSTAQIDVSWTGATLGQWHLGAVSHVQGTTVMGRTLVNVDNR
jgi:subtilisin family serine protease